MSAEDGQRELVAKEAARELVARLHPRYSPYFDIIWEARDRKDGMGALRGLDAVVIETLIRSVIPFVFTVSGIVVGEQVRRRMNRAAAKSAVAETVDSERARHPAVPVDMTKELKRILPAVMEQVLRGPVKPA